MIEPFSKTGVERLAKVVRQVKGNRSNREFARSISVSHTTFTRLFRAETIPDLATLYKIAEVSNGQYTTPQLVGILTGEVFEHPSTPDLDGLLLDEKIELIQRFFGEMSYQTKRQTLEILVNLL